MSPQERRSCRQAREAARDFRADALGDRRVLGRRRFDFRAQGRSRHDRRAGAGAHHDVAHDARRRIARLGARDGGDDRRAPSGGRIQRTRRFRVTRAIRSTDATCASATCSRSARPRRPSSGIDEIVDGLNLDDLHDYRPGMKAAAEKRVRHPLVEAELTKAEIRELSRAMGLPTWDRPASPCLSSRFPYGTEITLEGLRKVAAGEELLHAIGFRVARVRYHGDVARLKLEPAEIARVLEPQIREMRRSRVQENRLSLRHGRSEGFSLRLAQRRYRDAAFLNRADANLRARGQQSDGARRGFWKTAPKSTALKPSASLAQAVSPRLRHCVRGKTTRRR